MSHHPPTSDSHPATYPWMLRLVLAMMPFILFGIIYMSMGYYPNYLFNDIDIQGIYDAEKALFGIQTAGGQLLSPNEWFALHHSTMADLAAGIFYLCWVPLPVAFGIFLFATGRQALCFRFGCAFLFVNLIGFAGYYIHPAAPPWYVMKHGFEPIFGTGGDVAGLGRFDELIGYPVFASIYANNANVFAAVPSLHAAYCPIACCYAMKGRLPGWTVVTAIFSAGIWWTAIYSGHHYTIDVLLGIATTVLGLTVFETVLMRWTWWRTWMEAYVQRL